MSVSAGSKVSASALARSKSRSVHGQPARIGQRVCDRHAHVRQPEMREQGTVAQAHEPVHDRLRMYHDLDALVRHLEQPVRLDDLEALVYEGRRVDRHSRPIVQVGWRRACSGVTSSARSPCAPERAPGGGHDQLVGVLHLAREQLMQRAVLAVYRNEPHAAGGRPRARADRPSPGSPYSRVPHRFPPRGRPVSPPVRPLPPRR